MKKVIFTVLAIILVIFIFFAFRKKTATFENKNSLSKQSAEVETVASLNGTKVSAAASAVRPIAVVVENHPDARPQSGLGSADLVYETLAEGGITRFLAVYQTQNTENIGPVRSARTYFADLADELGAVFVHVGGNSDALANIKAGKYTNISDADEFFNGEYFHRISQRQAPHNMYTSIDKINSLSQGHNYSSLASYQAWQFKNDQPATTTVAKININFSLSEYAVSWQYNRENNDYLRFVAGTADEDAESLKQIFAKNLAVQFVKTWPVQTDTVGAIGMDLSSGGKAIIFQDGLAIEARWQKQNGRIRYYDKNNMEIKFNRGKIWVELVPMEKTVTWE